MGIFDWLCALWRFIAKLLSVIVETAVTLISKISKAAITILGDIGEAIGDTINGLLGGGVGGIAVLALGAFGIWMLARGGGNSSSDGETELKIERIKSAERIAIAKAGV